MPVNYQMDVVDPFKAALQGYGAGAQMLQQEKTAARQVVQDERLARQDEQQGQLFGLQLQEAQGRLAAMQAEREKAARAQEANAQLYTAMGDPDFLKNLPAAEIIKIASYDPELAKALNEQKKQYNDEQLTNGFNQNWALAASLEQNNLPEAQRLIDTYATAYENSGRAEDAKTMRGLGEQIKTPDGLDIVKKGLFVTASWMNPPLYDKLRTALVETIKLPYELRKLNLEADALAAAASGQVSPGDKVKLEDGYRTEYTKAAAPYKAMQEAMSSIFASAKLANPAGDVALVTQFRKLLDPTSVVRESEFAQTAEAGGLITKLQAELSKVSGSGLIAQETRDQIVALGRELMRKADGFERRRREDIDYRANRFGLDKKAIYGVGVAGEMPKSLPDFPNMTPEERGKVNVFSLGADALRLFIETQTRELDKLKGGR